VLTVGYDLNPNTVQMNSHFKGLMGIGT